MFATQSILYMPKMMSSSGVITLMDADKPNSPTLVPMHAHGTLIRRHATHAIALSTLMIPGLMQPVPPHCPANLYGRLQVPLAKPGLPLGSSLAMEYLIVLMPIMTLP